MKFQKKKNGWNFYKTFNLTVAIIGTTGMLLLIFNINQDLGQSLLMFVAGYGISNAILNTIENR